MLGATLRTIAIAATLGVLAACGAAVPPVPGNGGPGWVELTSPHFTVWTDGEPARVRELVREMERLRQVVVGVAFPSAPDGGRDLVIALHDDAELGAFTPTGEARAFAMPAHAPLWQPMIALPAFSNYSRGDVTVAHELTHMISYSVIHRQPRWFAEGMAKFFETIGLDPDEAKVDVGVAPSYRGQPLQMAHLIPISTLLTWRKISENESRQYSTAWALFTFLLNEHRAELVRYMQLLDTTDEPEAALSPEQDAQVWGKAFPSLPLGAVDGELHQWLLTGHHVVLHFNLRLPQWPVSERRLGDAEVYAIRGLLRATVANQPAQARADIAAALAAEPTNVLARLLTVALDHKKVTTDDARAITAVHQDDWRAWLLASIAMSDGHGDRAELEAARRRACELISANPALIVPMKLCPGPAADRSSP